MCGIVALLQKDGREPSLSLLSRMAERIAHRGPDEEGHLIEDGLGFFHKRLSIIDLPTGRQPMTCEHASIVFNGAVYNYRELREDLKARGRSFRTQSDTEVILQMYLEHGPDFIRQLNGMFAFLIYDRRSNRLMAARDHFGIKPLYYFEGEDCLAFASEIKALLAHPSIHREPDYSSLQDYLIFQYVMGGDTFFKGIKKLLPGHYLSVDLSSHRLTHTKYWELDFSIDTHHTEQHFIERLQELLGSAIDMQLRSDVPLGTYLSGGIDSSLVALMAAQRLPERLKTFTGAFREGPMFDETRYAKAVASECAAENYVIYPTEADFIELLPKLVYHMDEPAAGPGLFPQYMVSRLASEHVKVVLGGQGGDEIFGGYTRYVIAYLEQALKGAIFETNIEGEHIVSLQSILPNLPALQEYAPMMRHFWGDDLFGDMDRRYFRIIDRTRGDLSFLSADFRESLDLDSTFSRFQKLFNHPDTMSYYNKMVHFDLSAGLPALLQVEDRVTMAASLESRVPLLDHRIVELVTSMPPAMKFKGAEMKYILKRAVGDILPPDILARKDKMGFPVPLHIWARNSVRDYFRDILVSPTSRQRGLFDLSALDDLIDQEEAYGRKLWGIINIELWFRRFMDDHDA